MIPLEYMVRFFETVNDDWTSPIADQIASRWGMNRAGATCVRASANYVFRIKGEGEETILRFNHDGERAPENIQAELDFLLFLQRKGLNVNRPLSSRDGALVETVPTMLGVFHAVMFDALPGEHIQLEEMSPPLLRLWGRSLGELHQASQGYPGEGRPTWKEILSGIRTGFAADEAHLENAADDLAMALDRLTAGEDDVGLIHFDFEPDNIRWVDTAPGFLDFDDCCHAWFAADLVYALQGLSETHGTTPDPKQENVQTFLGGYQEVRDMPLDHLAAFPLFQQFHNLVSYARLKHSLGDDPLEEEPAWAATLRDKLQRRKQDLGATFRVIPA